MKYNCRFGISELWNWKAESNNNSTAYGIYANFGPHYKLVDFEDISTEDTIYTNEKNNRQIPIVLLVYYKFNRNKNNQRIELRKEVKITKTSTTSYKDKKHFTS